MKTTFLKIFAAVAMSVPVLSSCVDEDQPWEVSQAGKGTMTMEVGLLRPGTQVQELSEFPVTITNLTSGEVFARYNTAADVPQSTVMPVGRYCAEAHTPGALEKLMDSPYYLGRDTFEILPHVSTHSDVTCRMANGCFKVTYSSEFINMFTAWTITIDDGTSSVLSFTKEDGNEPAAKYLVFEPDVRELTVNFRATTKGGTQVVSQEKLSKKQIEEGYPTGTPYFAGGDAINLVFEPEEGVEGDVTGVTIGADIAFEETEETFPLDVEDKVQSGGDQPGEGDNAIVLELPEDMVVDAGTDPAKGDVRIKAEAGLKSITVKIISTSDDMVGALEGLAEGFGVDFINGAEVVGNSSVEALFSSLGQVLKIPQEGDKEYVFPVGNFFMMLSVLPGEHAFELGVTDMKGNKKSGVLTLTVDK